MPFLPIAPLLTNDNIGTHSMCTPCKNAVQHTKNHILILKNLYPIYKGITSALIKGEYSYMHVLLNNSL